MINTKALAQLRHVYTNLMNGGVRDTASAKRIGEGLLSPIIAILERDLVKDPPTIVAWRYRMAGDLQWQYTERMEQLTHADEVQSLTVMSTDLLLDKH